MSPDRSVTRGYSSGSSNSASSAKPYTRHNGSGKHGNGSSLPVLSPSAATASSFGGLLPQLDGQPSSQSATNSERPGFPTYAQYKQIETGYIESLTPRRQGKALISQNMFDRIWDVLHHPESQLETAQFRFWARKMFTINKNYRITLGVAEGQESAPQEVLLHDNLLVAIQEQLYDLLCYCHGSTGHGGRDKTCALIRKHYTWVPKDLVSNFIKACPTCIMKKCGNMDVGAVSGSSVIQNAAAAQVAQQQQIVSGLMAEADLKAAAAARLISSGVGGGGSHPALGSHHGLQQHHRTLAQDDVLLDGLGLGHHHVRPSMSNTPIGSAGRPGRRRVATVPMEGGGPFDLVDPAGGGSVFGIGASTMTASSDRPNSNRNHSSVYMKMSASVLGSSNTPGVRGGPAVSSSSSLGSSSSTALHIPEHHNPHHQLVSVANSAIGAELPWATLLGASAAHSTSHYHHQSGDPFGQHHHHPGLTLAPLMGFQGDDGGSMDSSSSASSNNSGTNNNLIHATSPHLPSLSNASSSVYTTFHQPIPMVREVSLYKGLPNGWQYRHDDFESAHAEFMDTKRQWDDSITAARDVADGMGMSDYGFQDALPNQHQPRIPDIAGLWGPEQFRSFLSKDASSMEDDNSSSINSLDEVDIALLGRGGHDQHMASMHQGQTSAGYPMPPPMMRHMDLSDFQGAMSHRHHSLGSPRSLDVVDAQHHQGYMSQIDPVLIGLASASPAGPELRVKEEDGVEAYGSTDNGIYHYTLEEGNISADVPMPPSEEEDHNDAYEEADGSGEAGMVSASATVTGLSQRRGAEDLHLELSRSAIKAPTGFERVVSPPALPAPPSLTSTQDYFGESDHAQPSNASGGSRVSTASNISTGSSAASTTQALSPFEEKTMDPQSAATTPASTPVDDGPHENEGLPRGPIVLVDAPNGTMTGTDAGDDIVKEFLEDLVASEAADEEAEPLEAHVEGADDEAGEGGLVEAVDADAQAVSAF